MIEPPDGVALEKVALETFDYSTEKLQELGGIERKSIGDLAGCMTTDRPRFDDCLRRMSRYRFRCVVVEGNVDQLWREHRIHHHAVIGSVASYLARHDVPTLFAGTRALAARMICGILRRWEERVEAESTGGDPA